MNGYLKIVISVLALTSVSALPECFSDRPGWADHRTLFVPETMMSGDPIDDAWAEALCCVYTYVEVISSSSKKVTFEIYDGSKRSITATTFEELATIAYEDICDMSMGSRDCRNQATCVENAFATTMPTVTQSQSPSRSPTNVPSISSSRNSTFSRTDFPSAIQSVNTTDSDISVPTSGSPSLFFP